MHFTPLQTLPFPVGQIALCPRRDIFAVVGVDGALSVYRLNFLARTQDRIYPPADGPNPPEPPAALKVTPQPKTVHTQSFLR